MRPLPSVRVAINFEPQASPRLLDNFGPFFLWRAVDIWTELHTTAFAFEGQSCAGEDVFLGLRSVEVHLRGCGEYGPGDGVVEGLVVLGDVDVFEAPVSSTSETVFFDRRRLRRWYGHCLVVA